MENHKALSNFFGSQWNQKNWVVLGRWAGRIPPVRDGRLFTVSHAIRLLQNELNSILNSFVNGGFSYKGFALYPLVKDISGENIAKLKRLKNVAAFLNNSGHDFSKSLGEYKHGVNNKNFALILSSLYNDFYLIKDRNAASAKKPICRELDIGSYKSSDLEYLKPLSELKEYANKNLKPYLSGFYLHGSLATKDYVKGWSDVDTVGIVSKETIDSPEDLLKLRERMYHARRFFYKIDPLQHHGSIIISECDLESYCNAYFPVPLFKYAKSFFEKDAAINFKVRRYSCEALEKLFWFVSYFRRLNAENRSMLGSYGIKTLLHSVTLFPTLYLQCKGIITYKKFSFDIAKKDFSRKEWNVIEDVSSIRLNWNGIKTINLPLLSNLSNVNPLLYYQIISRLSDLFNDIKKSNKINEKYIIKNMHRLSERAWLKVKKANQ